MADPLRWAPEKREVFDALADDFLHNYFRGRTLVAVDGIDGSGTRPFADALAERMSRGGHAVFRASIDDFQKPRAQRYALGEDSGKAYYRESFDYALLRRVLVEPFKLNGSAGFVTAAFDAKRDAQVESDWKTGPRDATLIIDGVFLNRPELRGLWNFSVWLELAVGLAAERRFEAAGEAGRNPRYAKGQALYLKDAKPREKATAIIDNSDPEHPRRLFADSC